MLSGCLPSRLTSLTRGIPVWRNLGLNKGGTHSPLQAVEGLELWPGCLRTRAGRPGSQPVYELAAWERSREGGEGFEYCRKKHHRLANGEQENENRFKIKTEGSESRERGSENWEAKYANRQWPDQTYIYK